MDLIYSVSEYIVFNKHLYVIMGVNQMNENEKFFIRQNTHIIPLYHKLNRKDLYDSWTYPELLDKSFKKDFDAESIYYEFNRMKEEDFHSLDESHEYLSENDRDVFEFSLQFTNKDRTLSDIPILLYENNQILSIHDITITLYGNGIGFLSYDVGCKAEFGDSAKKISAFCKKINTSSPIDLFFLFMPSEANKTIDFSKDDNIDELIASIYSNPHKFPEFYSFRHFIMELLINLFKLISSDGFATYNFFDNYKCMHYLVLNKYGINKEDIKNILPDFVPEYDTDKEPEEITHELFCYTDSNYMIIFSDNLSFIKYKTIQRVYTDILQQYYFLKSLSQLYAFEKLPKDPQAYAGNLSDELYNKIKELRLKINLFYLLNTTSFVSYKKSINDIYLYVKKEYKINEISGNLEKGVDAIAEMSQQVIAENNTKRLKKVERVVGILAFFGICSVLADSLSFCDAFFNVKDELPRLLENFNIEKGVPGQWVYLMCFIVAILALNITGLLGLIIPEGILNIFKKVRNLLLKTPKYIKEAFLRIKTINEIGWGKLFTDSYDSTKKCIRRTYILSPIRLYFRLLLISGVLLAYIVFYSGIMNLFDEEVQVILFVIISIYLPIVFAYFTKLTLKNFK